MITRIAITMINVSVALLLLDKIPLMLEKKMTYEKAHSITMAVVVLWIFISAFFTRGFWKW